MPESSSTELQAAVVAALLAHAGVAGIVGARVHDARPDEGAFPCISMGPEQLLPEEDECIFAERIYLQVDCWTEEFGNLTGCKRLNAQVKAALHDAALILPDPYALAHIRVTQMRAFRDADPRRAHGVVMLSARVQTVA